MYRLKLVSRSKSAVSLSIELAVATFRGTEQIVFRHDFVKLADVNFVVDGSEYLVEILQVSLL